uniref:2-(3-amino-3-carboxypropyl)histidine synthase subunit 2 n=1 Tax=Globodera rostochiensis TaxID=31243 RepID=A0A914GTZ0_GLORO
MAFSDISDLAAFFEVERLCSWILANNFRRTALQLPDELLEFAFQLVAAVERKLAMNNDNSNEEERKLYVLADTSYRSCCLDEIAAEHIACDSIVHFGDACLSECGSRMPALYIFGRRPFELDTFVEQFRAEIFNQIVIDQHWDEAVLICEAGYTHVQDSLEHSIASALSPSVQVHNFKVPMQKSPSNPSDANATELLGRQVPSGFDADGLVKKRRRFLIFVGSPDNPLLPIAQMTIRHIGKTVVYCPETRKFHTSETSAHRMLLRRLYLIERLRDARTVGLVIGAVALRGCREAVARVRNLCVRDGKRLYVMYIGKLNEAKLSNFGIDVDAFVLLSCPFGIIHDGTKFCRPILSVFEAEVALNPTKREWLADMRWTPNFEQLAKDEIGRRGAADGVDAIELVSLTSGNIRRHRSSDAEPDSSRNGGGQLLEYSAGNHFALRSWRGLEDNGGSGGACTDDQGTKCPSELKQGMDGIATRYVDEPSDSVIVQK